MYFRTKFRNFAVASGIVATLSCSTVLTPLWIDSINQHKSNLTNNSNHSLISNSDKHVDSFAVIFIVNFIYMVFSGIAFLFLILFLPHYLTDKDRKFPKLNFMLIGFSDALSTICLVYAASGTRTAPYLQSIASNFAIPVTFMIRFVC